MYFFIMDSSTCEKILFNDHSSKQYSFFFFSRDHSVEGTMFSSSFLDLHYDVCSKQYLQNYRTENLFRKKKINRSYNSDVLRKVTPKRGTPNCPLRISKRASVWLSSDDLSNCFKFQGTRCYRVWAWNIIDIRPNSISRFEQLLDACYQYFLKKK